MIGNNISNAKNKPKQTLPKSREIGKFILPPSDICTCLYKRYPNSAENTMTNTCVKVVCHNRVATKANKAIPFLFISGVKF